MIKLVTLDAAGTLIDHCWDPGGIAADAARSAGYFFDRDEARDAYGLVQSQYRAEQERLERIGERGAIRAMWQRQMADWLSEMGGERFDAPAVLSNFEELAFGPKSHVFRLFDDVRPALDAIKAMGIPTAVISNWDHTLFGVLESLGIDGEFEFVIASLVLGVEKPDPRIFYKACEQGCVAPENVLHVGDSIVDDLYGASRAGLHALLVDRSLPASFVDQRISSLTQIVEVIRCLN